LDFSSENEAADGSSISAAKRWLLLLLMVVLMAVGAFLQFPLGPVPLSLQTFFVLLTGFLFGPAYGALAAALYLLAGAVGLPVFAGGSAGLAKLLGPTGGFLVSFIPMAAIAGAATGGGFKSLSWRKGLFWGALASVVPFVLGVPWLEIALDLGWRKALDVGMFPFLPGAVIKLVLSVAAYRLVRKRGFAASRLGP